jgi:hypothetical protein
MHWRGWPDHASRGRAVGDLENDGRPPDVRAKRVPFNEIVARYLKAMGGRVEERSLVPLDDSRLGHIDEWLRRSQAGA